MKNQWTKPTNLDDAVKMIRKLKDLFPIACIVWQPNDVFFYCEEHDPEIAITQEQAESVISKMENSKDCNYGLTWNSLIDYVEEETD